MQRSYVAFWLAGFVLGVVYVDRGGALGWAWWFGTHLAVLGAIVAVSGVSRRSLRWTQLALTALAFVAGVFSSGPIRLQAKEALPHERTTVLVEGDIASVQRFSLSQRMHLTEVEAVRGATLPSRLVLWVESEKGNAEVSAYPRGVFPVGCRIRAWVRLAPLAASRNPGRTDPVEQAARQGLSSRASLLHPRLMAPVSDGCEAHPLQLWRDASIRAMGRYGEGGALLSALAMGERAGLRPERQDQMAVLGLSHLLAVSGLHLAWVAGLGFGLGRWMSGGLVRLAGRGNPRSWACVGAWLLASGYALWAGGGVPVQRAWFLVTALIVGASSRRVTQPLDALALAAACILWLDPAAVFSPGAQLSFAATAGLIWAPAGPEASWRLARPIRWTATALLATTPIAAFHFGQTPPFGLATNLIAVPWVGFVLLPVALVVTPLASLAEAEPGIRWASELAAFSLARVNDAAELLPVIATAHPPAVALVAAAVIGLGGLRSRQTLTRCTLLGVMSVVLQLAPARDSGPRLPRWVALDVGQGDAFLLQTGDANILIDGAAAAEGRFDRGRQIVVPALAALGVSKLDLVIVTHADSDHRGGIPAVLRRFPVDRIWLPAGSREDPAFSKVRETAARQGTAIEERSAEPQPLRVGSASLEVLWPPTGYKAPTRNAGSLVVRVEVAGHRLLFPGDLPRAQEAELLKRPTDLRADLMAVGHHGSRTSSSGRWLTAIDPSWAVVSAPLDSPFGVPHDEVVRGLAERGIPMAWTGRDGALAAELVPPFRRWHFTRTGWALVPQPAVVPPSTGQIAP